MSAKIDIVDRSNSKIGEAELSEAVFQAKVRVPLMHQVVVWQLAKRRAGTHSAKTRGQVSGGGAKPWRQKGTGRARAGTARSPLWRHGGVIFGPEPRSHEQRLNKKMRRAALISALSAKAAEGGIRVLDDPTPPEPKTREAVKMFEAMGIKEALVVLDAPNESLQRATGNLRDIKLLPVEGLNVYDVLSYEHLVFSKAALEKIEEVLS